MGNAPKKCKVLLKDAKIKMHNLEITPLKLRHFPKRMEAVFLRPSRILMVVWLMKKPWKKQSRKHKIHLTVR